MPPWRGTSIGAVGGGVFPNDVPILTGRLGTLGLLERRGVWHPRDKHLHVACGGAGWRLPRSEAMGGVIIVGGERMMLAYWCLTRH